MSNFFLINLILLKKKLSKWAKAKSELDAVSFTQPHSFLSLKATNQYVNKETYTYQQTQPQLSHLIKSNLKSSHTLKQNETEKLVRAFTSNNLKYSQKFKLDKDLSSRKKFTSPMPIQFVRDNKQPQKQSKRSIVMSKVFQSPPSVVEKTIKSINPRTKVTLKSQSEKTIALSSTRKKEMPLIATAANPSNKQVKWVSTKEVNFLIFI